MVDIVSRQFLKSFFPVDTKSTILDEGAKNSWPFKLGQYFFLSEVASYLCYTDMEL